MAELRANDRFALLLGLVPYLIELGTVSVAEIAEHFDVSQDAVRAAISTVVVSGVPDAGFYLHGGLFDIDWDDYENEDIVTITEVPVETPRPRLSSREAATLIASLQYLAALPDNRDLSSITELIAKLSLGASTAPAQITVALPHGDASIAALSAAIRDDRQVEFDYLNARGELQRRRVDPLRILSVDSFWYLKGWCHLRQGLRTFRLDQIRALEVLAQARSDHAAAAAVDDRLFAGSDAQAVATIDVDPAVAPFLGEYLSDTGHGPRHEVRVAHFHGLKRLAAAHAGQVVVLAPAEARAQTADWALEALARYQEPEG